MSGKGQTEKVIALPQPALLVGCQWTSCRRKRAGDAELPSVKVMTMSAMAPPAILANPAGRDPVSK